MVYDVTAGAAGMGAERACVAIAPITARDTAAGIATLQSRFTRPIKLMLDAGFSLSQWLTFRALLQCLNSRRPPAKG